MIGQDERQAMHALMALIFPEGSARESVPALMPGPLHVPHFLPESTNKRERDTMQRGSYIFLAAMAGAVALMGWSGRPASADLPSSDPAVAVTKTNLPTGWDAAPATGVMGTNLAALTGSRLKVSVYFEVSTCTLELIDVEAGECTRVTAENGGGAERRPPRPRICDYLPRKIGGPDLSVAESRVEELSASGIWSLEGPFRYARRS